MSDSISRLPVHPSLEQLQKRSKELLRQLRAHESAALQRFRGVIPRLGDSVPPQEVTLADAQFVIAREHGFESWAKLKQYIGALPAPRMEQYEQLARDLAVAHMSADSKAVREVNWNYSTAFVADFHDPLVMQQRLTTWFASGSRTPDLALADARQMVAHSYGLQSWESFVESVAKPFAEPPSAVPFMSPAPPFYQIDWKENRLSAKGPQSEKDWEAIFEVMEEHGITSLEAGGINDAAMKRLAQLDQITHLSVRSNALTDQGLIRLANMPQLVELEISGPQITDRGLEALRHLATLRRFQSCWTPGISDVGVANLTFCELLESVDLMGTAAGDGLIRALAGKPNLRRLKTGRSVTDAGIKLLHQIPAFKVWRGEEIQYGLMSAESQPNHLLIDGPFTDGGLADLVGLDGLFGLSFFWHSPAFTAAGLAPLRLLPKLGFLGCQGAHCDDEAMRQIATLPCLLMLMGQGAVASGEGWEALADSQTIEYIWGRECPNFTGRGLAALALMPKLRGIGISCKHVDEESLSALPSFPALREIMPMDVSDLGFRHVGRCENLEALWCMYCRDTSDAATEHIERLSQLKTYYAGMTKITDRSLEVLSRMDSLECLEFSACNGITDAGVLQLAALPRLREITVSGSPGVTPGVAAAFPANVYVKYSA